MLWTSVRSYLRTRTWTLLTLFLGVLFTSAAWPGWMNGDSGTQWMEASGEFLVADWHAPQLAWAWSYMNPENLGPLGPFLIQAMVFFAGLILIVRWAELRSRTAAMFVVITAVVSPFTWGIAWLTKDAFIVSFLSLSTGLFLSSTYLPKKFFWQIGSGLAIGVSAIGRPYMAPVLLLWAVALFLFITSTQNRSRILLTVLVPGITVSLLGVFAYPKVVPPYRTFASGAPAILDVARAECFSRPLETKTPLKGVIPRGLIVNGEIADVCSNFNPNFWDNISFFGATQSAHIRLPNSEDEADLLRDAWINAIREFPNIIFPAKVEAGVALLLTQANCKIPEVTNCEIPELKSSPSIEGRIGSVSSAVKDFPSRGGVLLALLLAPAQLLSATLPVVHTGLFWIFLVPSLSLIRYRAQNLSPSKFKKATFLSSLPLIWMTLFTLVTPAVVSRYWLPAGFMGGIAALILYLESKKPKV